jgi:hypothetical protein
MIPNWTEYTPAEYTRVSERINDLIKKKYRTCKPNGDGGLSDAEEREFLGLCKWKSKATGKVADYYQAFCRLKVGDIVEATFEDGTIYAKISQAFGSRSLQLGGPQVSQLDPRQDCKPISQPFHVTFDGMTGKVTAEGEHFYFVDWGGQEYMGRPLHTAYAYKDSVERVNALVELGEALQDEKLPNLEAHK